MSSQHPASIRKKTFLLPQDKLLEVKEFLGSRSETEAVVLSLDEVLWRKKLKKFLDQRPLSGFSMDKRALDRMRSE